LRGVDSAWSRCGIPSDRFRSFALVAAMTICPRCGSPFLQPLRCEAKGSDVVVVELRCPDCMTWLKAPHTRADMRELDRRQAEYRAEIVAQYERLVTESMEALAACWGRALELDLLGADDFAVTPARSRR
jgi:hypothetical protein